MDIRVENQDGDIATIRPVGRLDLLSAPDLKKRFGQLVSAGRCRLVVDLKGIVFIDSSGLGALISGIRETRLAHGDLLLAQPNDQAKVLLELTTLDQILRTYPTVSDAMQRFSE